MNKPAKGVYEDPNILRVLINRFKYRKFILDCGHKVTFGYHLGNDVTVINGKDPGVICSLCGHLMVI